jgi:Nif-specific regulatory protein
MTPKLITLTGPARGTVFALSEDELSVGREKANTVCLNDPSISRRHCLLKGEALEPEGEGRQFKIIDLESFNGTFVNGVPVNEQVLEHGDQVGLGDVLLLFLTHEAEAGTTLAVQLDEGDLITRSTIRLRQEDALYLRSEKAELPETTRTSRDLKALLRISKTINSIRDSRELQHRLLELILEVIPAEREVILLADHTQQDFASVCGWKRLTGPDDSIKVSSTITNQVLREGVALLSNDIFENESVSGTPSLVESRVCSLLCVPLSVFETVLGVIYVDTSDPTARFDEGHLQLLTAIAGIAAVAFDNAQHLEALAEENQRLQKEFRLEHKMVGESAPVRAVYAALSKVAASESTVLIRGESGTGKELAARAIHLNSPRATRPFVAINCATLSESLVESELFGHEKGAFTGAIAQKRGKLELADGGTIFFDEIGELTPVIQAKLLRVLQERQFERVGGSCPIKVDVRIIAATNRDLEDAIKTGAFRQDLYYRINVVSVTMPPLRDRRDDIPLLASYFVSTFGKICKRRLRGISPVARAMLQAYEWPGNVRELENAIERAVVLGSADLIMPEDLPETLLENTEATAQESTTYHYAVKEAKKEIILMALDGARGNYTEAAKLLGIHPNNLHRIIKSLNLKSAIKK